MASSPASPHSLPTAHKYVHEMSSAERLQSLKEWAEEKKFVQPGQGGTLPWNTVGGMRSLAVGSPPVRSVRRSSQPADKYAGQYDAPVGPPSYSAVTSEEPREKKGALGRWLERRKSKNDTKRRESAPPYVP